MKKNRFQAKHDPHLKRESEKYGRPVPSREHILTTLTESKSALILEDFLSLFEIKDEEGREGVRRRLLAMERDAQIIGNEQGAYRLFIVGQDAPARKSYFNHHFVEKVTQDEIIAKIVEQYSLPYEWPVKVLQECGAWGDMIPQEELKKRRDIRHLPLVTIDGEDAKDFDDAVYAELQENGHFKLYVAIADVSFYVRAGGATDLEAEKRGNSIYFPSKVIPMLPETLSNELCSLKPDVDRLCLVCEMEIDAKGVLLHSDFYEAVMRSQARLTYNQVAEVLNAVDLVKASPYLQHQKIWPHIFNFYNLFKVLYRAREERGALDFDTVEGKLILSAEGELLEIKPIHRNDAIV